MRAPASKGVHAYLLGGGSVSQDGISSSVEARISLAHPLAALSPLPLPCLLLTATKPSPEAKTSAMLLNLSGIPS